MTHGQEEGVSEVIATILILSITTVGISLVLIWGVPFVEDLQSTSAGDQVLFALEDTHEAAYQLQLRDTAFVAVLPGAQGGYSTLPGDDLLVGWIYDDALTAGCQWSELTMPDRSHVAWTATGCTGSDPSTWTIQEGSFQAALDAASSDGLGVVLDGRADGQSWRVEWSSGSTIVASAVVLETESLQWQRGDKVAVWDGIGIWFHSNEGVGSYRVPTLWSGDGVQNASAVEFNFHSRRLQTDESVGVQGVDRVDLQLQLLQRRTLVDAEVRSVAIWQPDADGRSTNCRIAALALDATNCEDGTLYMQGEVRWRWDDALLAMELE